MKSARLDKIRAKVQRGDSLTNGEGSWLLARAQNVSWAVGKVLRGERITKDDLRTVLEEFDYMPIPGEIE